MKCFLSGEVAACFGFVGVSGLVFWVRCFWGVSVWGSITGRPCIYSEETNKYSSVQCDKQFVV